MYATVSVVKESRFEKKFSMRFRLGLVSTF